jgi:hypothetical protein
MHTYPAPTRGTREEERRAIAALHETRVQKLIRRRDPNLLKTESAKIPKLHSKKSKPTTESKQMEKLRLAPKLVFVFSPAQS